MLTFSDIRKLQDSELDSLKRLVLSEVENRRENRAYETKQQLSIGRYVRVNHRKVAGKTFIVTEIKRVKAVVRENGKMNSYTVPLSLIELI